MSGAAAAVLLGRAGYRVVLIGLHAEPPLDFRVETLADGQPEQLRRLGLYEALRACGTPVSDVLCARRGKLVEHAKVEELNLPYHEIVANLHRQLPPTVEFMVSRVAGFETGAERQRVQLADGTQIDARLIVLATGPGDRLRRDAGIERLKVRDGHSITLGFDLTPVAGTSFDFSSLVYYGERPEGRIDYLRLFPMAGTMRANLFAYWSPRDPWVRAFSSDPRAATFAALPGIKHFLTDFEVQSKVEMRVTDLYVVNQHRRDGMVLIGDAFRMSCPAVGTGVRCLLTDVEQLCRVHIPRWFQTAGMNAAKISEFYDDPVKHAVDAAAAHGAEYRRKVSTETGLRWNIHRQRTHLQRRVRQWIGISGK